MNEITCPANTTPNVLIVCDDETTPVVVPNDCNVPNACPASAPNPVPIPNDCVPNVITPNCSIPIAASDPSVLVTTAEVGVPTLPVTGHSPAPIGASALAFVAVGLVLNLIARRKPVTS